MARQVAWAAALLHIASVGAGVVPESLISVRNADGVVASDPIITISEPLIMTPVPSFRHGNTKRDRRAALSLRDAETFVWSATDGTVAEFTVETPGDKENIVNLELIDDMVTGVQCPAGGDTGAGELRITFTEEADYDDAEDIWQWVSKDVDNRFLLVVGAGVCGFNTDRVVYTVTDLIYNDEAETAVLDVQQTTWKEAAHTYDLTVGKVPAPTRRGLPRSRSRRGIFDDIGDAFSDAADAVGDVVDTVVDGVTDAANTVIDGVTDAAGAVVDGVTDAVEAVTSQELNPDFSIPFTSDFSGKSLTFAQDKLTVSAVCIECRTTGSFDIRGRFRMELFIMKEAWVEASTAGILAKASVGLTVKTTLTAKLAEKSVDIFKFSPGGVSIPGLLTIGPTVGVRLGAEIQEVAGGIATVFGGNATIPPSTARLDFLSEDKTTSTGWKPTFQADPFKADQFIEMSAAVFLRAAIGLEISAVETGFSAELTADIPQLRGSLRAINSLSCTACGDSENGLKGSLTLGTVMAVSLNKKILGSGSPLWSLTLADAKTPEIAGFCKKFGLQGAECLAKP
ncbi:hypothetical protein B0H67DRAFT_613035 [Lasiosphaeris hirsuta]|uniref:Uncharacterized protein n=1 Tax=Lasiosphaeris hirsuta TaxID=260670 RepID=A0AA39ZV75_9PEZI|nr:hypothetical protein B0H67DRAFT_613035 [Lasiosphaeris hirsuta]